MDHGPLFVRLAWHCSGSYSKADHTGGTEGACMRFAPEANHGGNAGLNVARDLLEPIYRAHPEMTHADLYVFAANVAIKEMGGPEIATRFGRSDAVEGKHKITPDGRLPDATQGAQHIRDVFYRMGFDDREIVALIGVGHAIGQCHADRSGFSGPWTRSPTTVSNAYFTELLGNKWVPHVPKPGAPQQFQNVNGKDLMMLPADMALTTDPVFMKWCKIYADDEALLFKDFAAAWKKLTENGCK